MAWFGPACALVQSAVTVAVALVDPPLMLMPVTQAQTVAAWPSGVAAVAQTYGTPAAVTESTFLKGERSVTSTNVGRLVSTDVVVGFSVTLLSEAVDSCP